MEEKIINEKVPLKEKLFFGWADVYGGGAQALIGAVYFMFLIAMGLEPWMSAFIVAASKIWDAVTDPLMGIISDNTRTSWGRRRPYIFGGGFMILLAMLWLFAPINKIESVAFKFIFFLAAYIFYNTVSTVINVPYSSMSTEISTDYKERTSVNTIRLIFSMISGAISALLPTAIYNMYLDGTMSIAAVSFVFILGFGIFYTVPVVLCGAFTKERVVLPPTKSKFTVKTFLAPFKVKAFVLLLLCYLFSFVCMDILNSNIVYFIKYGIKSTLNPTYILAIIMGISGIVVPIIYYLMKKGVAKPVLFRIGIPLYIVGAVILTLYMGKSPAVIIGLGVMIGIGLAGSQFLPWIIFPDVIDVAELKMGTRPTGSFSGVMTFTRKASSALATLITGAVLSLVGFNKPITDPATGKVLVEPIQPLSAQWGLRLIILVSVVLFMTASFFLARKLKLTPARSNKIKEFIELQAQNKLDEMSEEDKKELEAIKKDLF